MKYINIYKQKLALIATICVFASSGVITACSKTEDVKEEPIEAVTSIEIYLSRLNSQIEELSGLLENSEFGYMKGNYPFTMEKVLIDRIAYLEETAEKLSNGTKRLNRSDMDNIVLQTISVKNNFYSSILTEDFKTVPAELFVDGKAGGYIDFGQSADYSSFDGGFTVELWLKIPSFGSFDYILSTFIDNYQDPDRYRYGWAVNYYAEGGAKNMRMTYVLGQSGLYEPWVFFEPNNEWRHFAFVWNPNKSSDVDSDPYTFKMYLDGNLVKTENWSDINYSPNPRTNLIGFNFSNFDGSIAASNKGSSGRMKHMHIWNSVKNISQIQAIKNNPAMVTGLEDDLVCAFPFDRTVPDDLNIKDLTGRHTARLVGKYTWIK